MMTSVYTIIVFFLSQPILLCLAGVHPPVITEANTTSTTIGLSWTHSEPADNYIISYIYAIRGCDGSLSGSQEISIGATKQYILTGLEENSNYNITLTAISAEMRNASLVYHVTTATAAPSGIPKFLRSSPHNVTSITVQWGELPCRDRNGEIAGYVVKYIFSSVIPPHFQTITVPASSGRSLIVGGLLPRTSYTFSVKAEDATISKSVTGTTSIPKELGFFLNGEFLSNNSIVSLGTIGEGRRGLYCLTNREQCCSSIASDDHWRFPEGGHLPESFPRESLYVERGFSSLRLNKGENALGPSGIFTCIIRDADDIVWSMFIGIYGNVSQGLLTTSLSYYDHQSHTLTCISSGGPVSTVTWRRNGVNILHLPGYQLSQKFVDGTTSTYHNFLTVVSDRVEDYYGTFSCIVNNSKGTSPLQSLTINDVIITRNDLLELQSSTNISCSSNLVVESIQWLNASNNGEEILRNYGEQELLLQIESVTLNLDNTMYICRVEVILANGDIAVVTSETILLRVNSEFAPRLPISVRARLSTASQVTIEWNFVAPYNSEESYEVSYGTNHEQLSSTSTRVTATPTQQMYSVGISSLEAGTVYFYRIESMNSFATVSTNIMSFTTNDSESGIITDLLVNSVNDTVLDILWKAPATPNGGILHYYVSIMNLADGSTVREETREGKSFTQKNLVPGVPYNLSIAAVNRAGPGELSVSIQFTKELTPRIAPRNVAVFRTSFTAMVVSWIPLSYSEARGFLSHYVVTYSPQSNLRKKRQTSNTKTVTLYVLGMESNETTIEGLDPRTDYVVQVSATTGAGDGVSTSLINPIPVEAIMRPSVVTSIHAESPSISTLILSWKGVSPGEEILHYVVRVTLNSNGEERNLENTMETIHVVTGLAAGVPYDVSIWAVNLAGPGDVSNNTYFTRELSPNTAPMDFQVLRTSGSTIEVSWTPLTLSEARDM